MNGVNAFDKLRPNGKIFLFVPDKQRMKG